MPAPEMYSGSVFMTGTFAHGERKGKGSVRYKRRDFEGKPPYPVAMRLRINDLRKAKGLTVEALAARAGISKSYLSEMSSGKKPINSNRLEAVARALGVQPVDLIDGQSVTPDLMAHIHMLSELSDADREAVLSHTEALARKDATAG